MLLGTPWESELWVRILPVGLGSQPQPSGGLSMITGPVCGSVDESALSEPQQEHRTTPLPQPSGCRPCEKSCHQSAHQQQAGGAVGPRHAKACSCGLAHSGWSRTGVGCSRTCGGSVLDGSYQRMGQQRWSRGPPSVWEAEAGEEESETSSAKLHI